MTTKRKRNALSAVFVQSVQETGTYADGGGLNLRAEDSGAKFWFQRVTIDGKRRNLGLGGYPTASLAEARKAALVNSRMIREGRDPLAEKREAITARQRPPTPTFAEASEIVVDMRRPTWTNAKHASQWASTLTTYAFPKIGPKPVTDITSADILSVLTPIWTAKPETASRVRQRMETVLDWAVAQGYRTDNPAVRSITKVLPRTPRTKQHFAALRYRDVPAALEQVNGSSADSITKLAFEFLVLTAARSGEVRLATWNEIDWRGRRWAVPAERMKARREHQVPLSDRSIEVLRQAEGLTEGSGELVFPGSRGRPLSDMVFTALLRRLDIPAVAHGFRSSFKDWCIECTDVSWAVGEAALAHNLGTSPEQTYARTDLFDQRKDLMQRWADFVVYGNKQATIPGI
jgi:integrase